MTSFIGTPTARPGLSGSISTRRRRDVSPARSAGKTLHDRDQGGEEMAALVGVYPDRRTADKVASALSEEAGAGGESLRVADPSDLEVSLRAEMDAELSDSWGSPGLGAFMTGEMVRGALLFTAVLGGLGLLLGTALTALIGPSSLDLVERATLGAIVGAALRRDGRDHFGWGPCYEEPRRRPRGRAWRHGAL